MKMEDKLDHIEKEISELKIMIMQQNSSKKKISLKGALKGMKVSEKDIEKAKKSLFKSGV